MPKTPRQIDEEIAKRWWRQHLTDQRLFGGRMNTILNDAAKEAARYVEGSVGSDSVSLLIRRTQYAESRSAIVQANAELWSRMETATMREMDKAAGRAVSLWDDVNARLGDLLDTRAAESAFRGAAHNGVEHIRSRYINSVDLADTVYKNQQLSMGLVDKTVNNGILLNKSAREIAADVRGLIRPDVRGGVSYAAKRLGRTELNNAFHETTRRNAEAQPWVEGMQWHLSGSHPRPDECNRLADSDSYHMGSGVYPASRVPPKPHPQCLCYISSVTKSNKDFVDELFAGKYDAFLAEGASL